MPENNPAGLLMAKVVGITIVIVLAIWWIGKGMGIASDRQYMNESMACLSNMHRIADSLSAYAAASGGRYPDDLRDALKLSEEVDDPTALRCPLAPLGSGSYVYCGKGLSIVDGGDRLVVYEREAWHLGRHFRNAISADGATITIGEVEFKRLRATP